MTALHISDETTLIDSDGAPLRIVSGSLSVVQGEIEAHTIWGQVSLTNRDTGLLSEGYTALNSDSQLSFVSDSTDDFPTGLGSWTIRVSYYEDDLVELKQEDLSMNGTTPVNTIAVTIKHVEKVAVVTSGVSGGNVGTITIYSQINGAGYVVGTIQPAANQTFFGHHFVPAAKRCWVKDMSVSVQGGVHPCATFLKAVSTSANATAQLITNHIRCGTNAFSSQHFALGVKVAGPARITQWAKSDGVTRIHISGSFTYYEESL